MSSNNTDDTNSNTGPEPDLSGFDFPTTDVAPAHPPPQTPIPHRMNPFLQRINRYQQRRKSPPPEKNTPLLEEELISPGDFAIVQGLLGKLGLPLELALSVLLYADYRCQTEAYRSTYKNVASLAMRGSSNSLLYLITPAVQAKVTSVTFAFLSHDQGWAGDKTSYSWFEASILRRSDPNNKQPVEHLVDKSYASPADAIPGLQQAGYEEPEIEGEVGWPIQANEVASRESSTHVVTWERDQPLIKQLRVGDRIAVWARAQYPGWENHVHRAEVRIKYYI